MADGGPALDVKGLPSSFAELKEFYFKTFRPLYDRFMNAGAVAQEIHAEMSMALDHFFCKSGDKPGDIPQKDLERVCGHLKRATFDGFKLIYEKEIRVPYDRYMDNRYAEVHDGDFRREITEQWLKARTIADEARALERRSREYDVSWDAAFEKWNELLPIAEYFNALLGDPKVIRAKGKSRRQLVLSVAWQLFLVLLGTCLPAAFAFIKGLF